MAAPGGLGAVGEAQAVLWFGGQCFLVQLGCYFWTLSYGFFCEVIDADGSHILHEPRGCRDASWRRHNSVAALNSVWFVLTRWKKYLAEII